METLSQQLTKIILKGELASLYQREYRGVFFPVKPHKFMWHSMERVYLIKWFVFLFNELNINGIKSISKANMFEMLMSGEYTVSDLYGMEESNWEDAKAEIYRDNPVSLERDI